MTFVVETPNGTGHLVRTAHGTEYVTVTDVHSGKLSTWHQSQVRVVGKEGYQPVGRVVNFKGCQYKIADVSDGYALVDIYKDQEITKLGKLIPLEKLEYV